MGKRQTILSDAVFKLWTPKIYSKPKSFEFLQTKYSDCIFQTYRALDGCLTEPPIRFGPWDISTSKFVIELDEERHFNRYRLKTLKTSFYKEYKYFSVNDYIDYCTKNESACLKAAAWGKNWKNDSTEKQFPKSEIEGILTGNGSTRWKQRAYYDFLKDISSKIIGVPVLRISIYEHYKKQTIDQLLKSNNESLLQEFIKSKIVEII